MKIRMAIVERDNNYTERLLNFFSNRYSDKLELHIYSSLDMFREQTGLKSINIVLVDESIETIPEDILNKVEVAYLTESSSIDSIGEIKAICKYQKPDLIYKEVLKLLAEKNSQNISYKRGGDGNRQIKVFMPCHGGAGSSTLASAYAKGMGQKGIRTLYINLEKLPTTDVFFKGSGTSDFGDVIYALKSKKANLGLKLESFLKEDHSGVHFYGAPKTALNMLELSDEDIENFLDELRSLGNYEVIVIDMDLNIEKRLELMAQYANSFILSTEESEIALKKTEELSQVISIFEENKEMDLKIRTSILINKCGNVSGKTMFSSKGIEIAGQVPLMPQKESGQMIQQIINLSILDKF